MSEATYDRIETVKQEGGYPTVREAADAAIRGEVDLPTADVHDRLDDAEAQIAENERRLELLKEAIKSQS